MTMLARAMLTRCAIFLWSCCLSVAAGADHPAKLEFFESKIRPVLIEHCYECHAADSKNVRGGLQVDTREAIRLGGDSGPAVIPGKPDESLILGALRHEDVEMPPSERLPDDVIEDFERWIRDGAVDPRDGAAAVHRSQMDIEAGRQHWAFQPIPPASAISIPDTNPSDWPLNEIDHFLLEPLLATSPSALMAKDCDPAALLRRIKFDLLGLPPTVAEIERFVADPNPSRISQVVDEWLQSPHFGERWGRHWLDVARFAESSGGGRSLMFPHAWRYRDYVIEAFNEDLPFDQFVREQIAGDLLTASDPTQRDRQRIAAGFLALGPINYELQDKELLEFEIVDEQIDTIGRAFLGLTLGCARCHDHKFDPIPADDYYALAGIMKSTQSVVHQNVSRPVLVDLESDPTWPSHLASEKVVEQLYASLEVAKKSKGESPKIVKALEKKLKKAKSARISAPKAMTITEQPTAADLQMRIRGEIRNLGPVVPRGFVQVVARKMPDFNEHSSGRFELAEWIASADNPLTARVYVNRVWQHLMGAGLVSTPDNFGMMGQACSHPQLLDYLARHFMENGWSTKWLVRQIVHSRAYRMDTQPHAELAADDPDNRRLTHANRRPLDAEAIRDALLQISGELELTRGGLTIRKLSEYDYSYKFETVRRSVYVPRFRNAVPDLFRVFDYANPNLVTGLRNASVLPSQALYLSNSPYIRERAAAAGGRLIAAKDRDSDERLNVAFLRSIGRWPTEEESSLFREFLTRDASRTSESEKWSEVFHLLFQSLDFRYLD